MRTKANEPCAAATVNRNGETTKSVPNIDLSTSTDTKAAITPLHAHKERVHGLAIDLIPAASEDGERADGSVGRQEMRELTQSA
jgi:hypothetical protein